jgi:hypothetical protein
MTKIDYFKFWKKGLIKYEYDFIDFKIPKSVKTLIKEWGLPNSCGPNLNFKVMRKPLVLMNIERNNYAIIGHDYEIPFGLRQDGSVWSLECDEVANRVRFVNSSLKTFIFFLCEYQLYLKKITKIDEKDEDAIQLCIDETEKEMQRYDIVALQNEENYWTVIIEQMRYGMI